MENILRTDISQKIFWLSKFDHKPDGSGDFVTGLDLIFIVDVTAVVFIVVVIAEKICRCLSLSSNVIYCTTDIAVSVTTRIIYK